MKTTDWILLVVLSLVWGGSFFFNEIGLRELPVLSIVALRVAIAAVILWAVVLVRGHRIPSGFRHWSWFLTMGLVNNVLPFTLIVYGQTSVTAGLASILNATTPFFMVLIIALFLRDEIIARRQVTGLIIGFLGVVLMLSPDILKLESVSLIGQAAVLCAAISYSIAGIYGRRFQNAGIPPVVAAAGQVTMSAVLLLPVAIYFNGVSELGSMSGTVWMSIMGLAVLSTALAYILYFRILNSAGAVNLMLVTFLMPVSALALGTFLLHEPVQMMEIVGISIIAIALVIIDGRLFSSRTN